MKGSSNIISGIHCLAQAFEHFDSFRMEHPGSAGEKVFKIYNNKIEWIAADLISHPFLPQEVRDGIRKEWESDVFIVPAIAEKVALLNPNQREMIESLVDAMLSGEEVNIVE